MSGDASQPRPVSLNCSEMLPRASVPLKISTSVAPTSTKASPPAIVPLPLPSEVRFNGEIAVPVAGAAARFDTPVARRIPDGKDGGAGDALEGARKAASGAGDEIRCIDALDPVASRGQVRGRRRAGAGESENEIPQGSFHGLPRGKGRWPVGVGHLPFCFLRLVLGAGRDGEGHRLRSR